MNWSREEEVSIPATDEKELCFLVPSGSVKKGFVLKTKLIFVMKAAFYYSDRSR